MFSLADREKRQLLEVARRTIEPAAGRSRVSHQIAFQETKEQHGGVFVTLRVRGRLRGCMGQIESSGRLDNIVAHCARSAALEDRRFAPLRIEELPDVRIEISVLSPMEGIPAGEIVAGRHGVFVSREGRSGLLLPQVAKEFRWTATRLLEETCVKAGLDRNAWKIPGTNVAAFTADVFGEDCLSPSEAVPGNSGTAARYSSST